MKELAAHGDALVVGRGGSRFLAEHPEAFHVRLVAPMAMRVRKVMADRWLREVWAGSGSPRAMSKGDGSSRDPSAPTGLIPWSTT